MNKYKIKDKTSIRINKSYEGESIETKVRRIIENKEPIEDVAPMIYTSRKDGVQPQYDIRTDRFELAIEAMDKVQASKAAKRDAIGKELEENSKNIDTGNNDNNAT